MNFDKNLIDIVNSKGMVVREVKEWDENQFGKTNLVTIEDSSYRITFITNVLHGVNYFKIVQVHDLQLNRKYNAWRYFRKFISLVNDINGLVYIANQKTYNSI